VGITLDLYSHVTPTMQREATAAMGAIISGYTEIVHRRPYESARVAVTVAVNQSRSTAC
jgi:hypothetical protein